MNNNILLVWDRMGDYHRARWHALQAELPDRKIFAADLGGSDNLYGWNSTSGNPLYVLLSEKSPGSFDFNRLNRFIRLLSQQNIGIVCISGYGKIEYLFFILYGKITGLKIILFAESWYRSNFIFDKLKSLFLRLTCNGFLVSGSRAYEHFHKRLNISGKKLKIGYSVVDNQHFSRPVGHPVRVNRTLLCVARFAPEKNLQLLITTFLKSNLHKNNWVLHIVGGGPLKSGLEQLAGGNPNIVLSPWKSYDELPNVYHNADVFILLSTFEPWGLVVNEAMGAGLPLVLSKEVGCVPDLLPDDQNGLLFDGDETDLVKTLDKISGISFEKLKDMGIRSKDVINRFSLRTFAVNLKSLIDGH